MTARTWLLFAAGEQYVSSSLTAILIASMPLMVALLSTRFSPADKPGGLRLAGLVGAALVLVATLGYATAPIIVNRRLADLDPLGPIAVSLGLAIVALLPAAIVTPPVAAASAGRPPAP